MFPKVVRKLLFKAPQVDEIHPEYLKSLDVQRLSWLPDISNIVRWLETVPLDLQTRVVITLLRKGTEGCA